MMKTYATNSVETKSTFLIELYKCPLEIIGPPVHQKLLNELADFLVPGIFYEHKPLVRHNYPLHDLVIAKLQLIKGIKNVRELSWAHWNLTHKYCINIESENLPTYEHYKIFEEIKKIPGIEHVAPFIPKTIQ